MTSYNLGVRERIPMLCFGDFWKFYPPHTGTYVGVLYQNFTKTTQKTILNTGIIPLLIFRDRAPEVQVSDLAVFQAILQEAKMGIKIKNLFLKSQLKKVHLLFKRCSFSFRRTFASFWTEKKISCILRHSESVK